MKKNNFVLLLTLIVLFIGSGCATKKVNSSMSSKQASGEMRASYVDALRLKLVAEIENVYGGSIEKAAAHYTDALNKDKTNEEAMFKLGLLDIQQNKLPQAKARFETLIKLNPSNTDAKRFLAGLYVAQGNVEASRVAYEDIVKPGQIYFIEDAVTLSHLYLLEKKHDKAIAVLDDAEKKFKSKHIVYFYKGRAYSEQKNFAEARVYFLKSKKSKSNYIPNLKALGFLESYEGNDKEAFKYFEKILKINPEDALVRQHLAEKYLEKEKFKKSKKHYLVLHEQDEKNANYLIQMSINHYYLDEYTESKAYLLELIKHHPQHKIAYYYLGLLQEKTENFEKAKISLAKVSPEDEYFEDASIIYGQILFDQDKKEESEKYLLAANEKKYSPRFVMALSRFYSNEKQFDKAERILQKFKNKEKDNQQYLFSYAQVLEAQDKFDEMSSVLLKVIERNPNHAQALNYLGYSMLERDQDSEEAYVYIKRAHNIAPKNPYIMDSLGWVYYKRDEYKKALKYLKGADDLVDNESIIKKHIADTYIKLKQKKKAKFWYLKALALSKDEKEIKEISEKISKL